MAGESAAVRAPGFVGREGELRTLGSTLNALAAAPAVVLVAGEAGIGKSRLVAEFLGSESAGPGSGNAASGTTGNAGAGTTGTAGSGTTGNAGSGTTGTTGTAGAGTTGNAGAGTGAGRVLVAACPPFREPYTLGPVVDAVREATSQVAGLGLSALAGALRPLFPEWAADLPPSPEPLDDASAARHRLFRALAELVGCLSVRFLVVEDVQWADDATMEFLLFLAARRDGQPSLLLTYRPDEIHPDSLLPRLARPATGVTHLRLELTPLDVDQTAAVMSSMLNDEPVSATFARFVHERTEGVPLAVEESVRLMADRADLARRNGEWVRRRIERIEVPPSVRDAVLERVTRLAADELTVLRAAGVLTEPADEPTLAAVAGLPADRVVAALATLVEYGLLTEDGAHKIGFRHVLAAQAVHDAIPLPLRRQLHLRAGRALEPVSPAPTARLARHFREAGEQATWCRYAEQAADMALASGDYNGAIALLYEAVTSSGLTAGQIAGLASKIPIHYLTGAREYQSLIDTLRCALDDPSADPGALAQTHYQLSRFYNAVDDIESAMAEAILAIPGLPPDSPAAVKAMMTLGWPRDATTPKSQHVTWLGRVSDAIGRLPAASRLPFAVDVASALLAMGEEAGWAAAARLPDDAATVPELVQVTRGLLNVGDHAMRWGRYRQAAGLLAKGRRLARENSFTRPHAELQVTSAHLRWFAGDWDGLAMLADSLAAGDDLVPIARGEALLVRGLLWLAEGDISRATDCLRQVLTKARSLGAADFYMEPAAALARIYLEQDRVADAITVTDEPAAVLASKQIWIWGIDLVPARVRALAAAGRLEDAADLVTAFTEGLSDVAAPAGPPATATARAWLTAVGGGHPQVARIGQHERPAEAPRETDHYRRSGELFGEAARAWAALPRPYDALLATEQQGARLLAGGDRRGLDLLTETMRGLAALGATGDADRVARLVRVHGGIAPQTWRGGRRGYGTELSPRELDVVRLVVTGRTNRQIAELVHRSPDTVASQLKSAMRKLGVATRTELAVRAAEAGIG